MRSIIRLEDVRKKRLERAEFTALRRYNKARAELKAAYDALPERVKPTLSHDGEVVIDVTGTEEE